MRGGVGGRKRRGGEGQWGGGGGGGGRLVARLVPFVDCPLGNLI